MTNFEKYKNEIRKIIEEECDIAVCKGEPANCYHTDCDECDLYEEGVICRYNAIKWFTKDDGEPSAEAAAARKQGQEEAWELAQNIMKNEDDGGFSMSELNEIFGDAWDGG